MDNTKEQQAKKEQSKKDKPEKAKKAKKKQKRTNVGKGVIYIKSTFNNTLITATDSKGEVVAWSSGGVVGNKGTRKSTPFSAAQAAKDLADKVKRVGMTEADVFIKGPGPGKETALKALGSSGIRVTTIRDAMSFAHNGCRPKKKKR